MVFSSLLFLFFFLPLTLGAYYLVPWRWKNAVLLAASLLFYAWGEPVYMLLMLFSIGWNYACARGIARGKHPKAYVALSVAVSLALLGFFKYADWAIGSLNAALGLELPLLALPLPIGISFYTFQILSYTIDVYRGHVPVQKNIVSFGAYVTMFPQLIAGPIVRYADVAAALSARTLSVAQFCRGCERFLYGLVKKVLLANNIGLLWAQVQIAPARSALYAWVGLLAFTLQIYFDFSGYSDMAIGMGDMLGFRFPENFDHPYMSRSVSEFWRRWHMTLGTWFRQYLYIPLGGNRRGRGRTIFNLAVVWLLTGLWHGASWNFVLWGAWFGMLIIGERFVWGRALEKLPRALATLVTFLLVMLGWVLFSFTSMADIGAYMAALLGAGGAWDAAGLYALARFGPLLMAALVCATPLARKVLDALRSRGRTTRALLCTLYAAAFVCCVAYLVDASFNPFLYFRF
nr:MBOAT family O-acyltransferase [Maliibacterium massiliense]